MKKPQVGPPVGASAVVTLTIEVRAQSSWGKDCSLAQVHRQAAEETSNYVRTLARAAGNGRIKIVGEPEVKTIITERA